MKKILTLAVLALLSIQAYAQVPTYAIQSIGLYTNWVTASAANLFTNAVVDCRKQASVTVQLTTTQDQTSSQAFRLYYARSVDGITYEPNSVVGFVQGSGNTTLATCTNLNSYGSGYIKLMYLTNGDGTANITNYTIKYGVKISSP